MRSYARTTGGSDSYRDGCWWAEGTGWAISLPFPREGAHVVVSRKWVFPRSWPELPFPSLLRMRIGLRVPVSGPMVVFSPDGDREHTGTRREIGDGATWEEKTVRRR